MTANTLYELIIVMTCSTIPYWYNIIIIIRINNVPRPNRRLSIGLRTR